MIESLGIINTGIIAEPNTVFLNYQFKIFQSIKHNNKNVDPLETAERTHALVVDMGGGTTDVSFLVYKKANITCLASTGRV